jgi:hypothetical protein
MRTLACALLVGWGLAASGCTKPTEVRTAPAVVVGRYVIVHCQPASKFDPRSASNIDPFGALLAVARRRSA